MASYVVQTQAQPGVTVVQPPGYGYPQPMMPMPQPGMMPATTVVVEQVTVPGGPVPQGGMRYDLSGVREFSNGYCGCFDDCAVCFYGYFCGSCMACDVAKSLDEAIFYCWLGMLYRQKIRHQYRIQGSACNDCLSVHCCPSCAYCQMYREIKHYGDLDPCCCSC